jgi:hypothetical protein
MGCSDQKSRLEDRLEECGWVLHLSTGWKPVAGSEAG